MRIANEFVSEGSASEVAAAGINAIREICVRQPLAMNEALLSDLVQYQRSKDKGVVMAAKSLQTLYRDVYPELLQKKHRGKEATMGIRSGEVKLKKFGEQEASGIEGIELLEKHKEEERERKRAEKGHVEGTDPGKDAEASDSGDNDDDDDGWEVASSDNSDNDSGGWIAVSSDDEPEERPPSSKRQRKDTSETPDLVSINDATAEEDAKAREERKLNFLTSTILSQADLKKLRELQEQAAVDKAMGGGAAGRRKKELIARHIEDGVTAETLELASRIGQRASKEERVERAREGKPDRDEHKSTQAIRKYVFSFQLLPFLSPFCLCLFFALWLFSCSLPLFSCSLPLFLLSPFSCSLSLFLLSPFSCSLPFLALSLFLLSPFSCSLPFLALSLFLLSLPHPPAFHTDGPGQVITKVAPQI